MKTTSAKAFTVAELLVSLAIAAILMAAVATAVHGSLMNQTENAKIADASQAARFVLHRIMGDIRTAAAIDPYAGATMIKIVPPADGSGTQELKYQYNPSSESLNLSITVSGDTTTQTLFGGQDDVKVRSFHAIYELGQDWQGLQCTKSVTIRMEFEVRNQTFALTTSASPRRNLLY